MGNCLRNGYRGFVLVFLFCIVLGVAAGTPKYYEYYNPDEGFKFGAESFSEVYLQIAGSLEHHGSPEPYICWVFAEIKKSNPEVLPDYFTDEYTEQLIDNWNKLEAPLQLDKLSREAGLYMRYALRSSVNGDDEEIVGFQSHLSSEKLERYRYWVENGATRADLTKLDSFYREVYDDLNPVGQNLISIMVLAPMRDQSHTQEIIKGMLERGTLLAVAIDAYGKGMKKELSENRLTENDDRYLEKFILKEVEINGTDPDYSKLHLNTVEQVYFAHLIKKGFDERIAFIRERADADLAARATNALIFIAENINILAHKEFVISISN